MNLDDLAGYVVKALCTLDASVLEQIDQDSYYSHHDKQEVIQNFNRLFDDYKSKGIKCLKVKDSQCKYCYPHGKAYSFHHPITGEFIIRYVLAYDKETDEGEKLYKVEECKNDPIPDDFWEKLEKKSK